MGYGKPSCGPAATGGWRPREADPVGALHLCAGGLAQRAHIVLLTVQGVSNTEIAERVGVTRNTVIAWRARYG